MEQSANFIDTSNIVFSVKHNKDISWNMRNYHFHQAFEIYFSLSDDIRLFVSDKLYHVNKNDLLVFNKTDLHRSVAPENVKYERYIVYFDPNFVSGLSTLSTNLLDCFLNRNKEFSHCIHLTDLQAEALLNLMTKAVFYCSNEIFGADIYRRLVLAEILLFINSLYRTSLGVAPIRNDRDFKKIEPVLQYIQEHLNEELCLDGLTRKFFLSKSHLCILFKKVTGFTINEYIVRRRVLQAAELLKKGISVTQVCEMVGFNNLSHFIRTFTNMMHVSPKQYARK